MPATVSSTGISFTGRPASTNAVEVLRRRGIDIAPHRSRELVADQLMHADLVICMERSHVREAVVMKPGKFPRIFSLKEIVRRGEQIGPRMVGEDVERWLDRAGLGRRPQDHLGSSPDDDVADPIGMPLDAYERTASELADLIDRLVDLMWPPLLMAAATHDSQGDTTP